ncbi:MAG: MlaD family protein [Planctomycetota bacterium]
MNSGRQLLLGLFFLVTIGTLAFFTLFMTDFDPFGDPVELRVAFPEANELRQGDPVMVQGLRIGRVKSLEFVENGQSDERIHAVLNLDEPVELRDDASIMITESTMLGGRQIDIFPGTPDAPPLQYGEEDWIRGVVKLNPFDQLGALGEMLDENSVAFKAIVDDLEAIMESTRAGRGTIGRLLMDEQMGADFSTTVANLRGLSDSISRGSGTLGALINDEALATSVRTSAANIERVSGDLAGGRGLLGRLISDEGVAERVTEGLESFASVGHRLERGEGALGMLLSDPDMARKVALMVDDLGAAGADVRRITTVMANGEGTLGRLLMDDGMYAQLAAAIGLITRSLEDYREAAPIATFTSVLFSGF